MTNVLANEQGTAESSWGLTIQQSHPIVVFSISIMSTIAIASIINWQNLDSLAITKLLMAFIGCVGLFIFFLRLTGYALVSAAALPLVFILLPFLPFLSLPLYGISFIGWSFLRPNVKIRLDDLFSIGLLVVISFETEFLNGFFFEGMLDAGLVTKDTYFHSAIAASYAHYLTPSIAIDGLLPVQYHVLSHKIFAGFAIFSQLELLQVYAYAFTALAPTILVYAMASFAKAIKPQIDFGILVKRLAAAILFIILELTFRKVAFFHSFLASESFLTALVLSLLSFASLWKWSDNNETIESVSLVLCFVLMCMAGMSKASLAVLNIAALGVMGLFFFRNFIYFSFLTLSLLLLFLALRGAANVNASSSIFDPFMYIYTYSMSPKSDTLFTQTTMFIGIHFLAIWICMITGFLQEKKNYIYSKEFSIITSITVVSIAIAIFLNFPAGANGYFTMVPMMFGLCFLVTRWTTDSDRSFNVGKRRLNKAQMSQIVTTIFLMQKFLIADHFYPQILEQVAKSKDPVFASYINQIRAFRDQLPREAEVRIENVDLLTRKIGCGAFFLAPALLEHPINGGIPKESDCPGLEGAYGLATYQNPETLAHSRHFPVYVLRLKP